MAEFGFLLGAALTDRYLATLRSPASRRAMAASLDVAARIVADRADVALGDEWPSPKERLDWASLSFDDAVGVKAALAARYAPNTVNRHLAAVRGVVTVAQLSEVMPLGRAQNVCRALAGVPREAAAGITGASVSAAQLAALFADIASRHGPVHRRDAAMLALLAMCALRREELVNLDLADVHDDGNVAVRRGKGGRSRLVFVHGGAQAAVTDWLTVRGSVDGPLLFAFGPAAGERDRMTGHGVWKRLRWLCRQAGVETFAPHDLRRWAITELLRAGQDVIAVRDLAGHASVQTTAGYDQRGVDAARSASRHLCIPFVPEST
jgi:integrase/recombinase XerD